MRKQVTWADAKSKGLPRYFTGRECRRGHIAERFTSSKECLKCKKLDTQRRQNTTDPAYRSLKKKEKNLRDRYNLELTEYLNMVEKQGGRCGLCQAITKKLVVDHCHDQEKVRELLCERCNRLLGAAGDNITLLHLAVDYIIKHS